MSKCAELKSAPEDVKNAYRMFLRAKKRCFLSLLKNLLKPTYTSCELGRRYVFIWNFYSPHGRQKRKIIYIINQRKCIKNNRQHPHAYLRKTTVA